MFVILARTFYKIARSRGKHVTRHFQQAAILNFHRLQEKLESANFQRARQSKKIIKTANNFYLFQPRECWIKM